jgi:hypothetical protein
LFLNKSSVILLYMLKISRRPANVHDFLNLKGYKPWKNWRKTAKTENFSLLFGCAPNRFGSTLRENGFSEKDCDELIQDAGLTDTYMQNLTNYQGKLDTLSIKYLTCAVFMRNGFFDGYKGLQTRIEREMAYGVSHGYVRCWHGPVRHLPELLLMQRNSKGNLVGADKELWSKYFSELKNIACNSTIQTLEVRIAFATIHYLCSTMKAWHFRSFMYSMCHDSEDWVIYDEEQDLVLALIKYAAEYYREPVKGVPMKIDFELSDLSTEESRSKFWYHHGDEVEVGDINVELKKYNETHHTSLQLPPMLA